MTLHIKTRHSVVPPKRPPSSKLTHEIEKSLETLKTMVRSTTKNAKEQKRDSSKELEKTIEFIDCLIEKTRREFLEKSHPGAVLRHPSVDGLTHREKDVLSLIASGLANKNIAKKLHISVRTVEVHRSNLIHKLGIRTTAALVRYAISQGFA